MQGKRYLFFDLDGTLIDPRVGITGSVAYALGKLGIEVDDPDSLTRFIGPPLEWSFREYYSFDSEKAAHAASLYRESFSVKGIHENELYDGIIPMLEKLSGSKKLVIATSKPEPYAKQISENLGFARYFDAVCGAEFGGKRANKDEVIAYAMERCGCKDPSEIVMVGDRMHDIIGAKKNGVQSVGVLYGYGSRRELTEAGADYIAETVGELAELLLGLRS